MKKNILALAVMVLTAPLYAQPEQDTFSRAEILDIFARFNPAVLERAKQNPQYDALLQDFLNSYQQSPSPSSRYELIAVARNFDNSIQLRGLLDTYYVLWTGAKMSGADIAPTRQKFTTDVTTILENVWAVTVSLRQYQLDEAKAQVKKVRADKSLDAAQRQAEEKRLKGEIKALQAELKTLQKNPGQYVVSAAEDYVSRAEKKFLTEGFAVKRQAALQHEQTARQSQNLQVKANNKKPVAK